MAMRARFGDVARRVADAAGSAWAFATALAVVLGWAVTGPLFGFSEGWQLVINTTTTIATFLMVFLIQHAQNRDTKAMHVKLNEVVAAVSGADNQLIAAERLDERELAAIERRFEALERRLERKGRLRAAASVAAVKPSVILQAAARGRRGSARAGRGGGSRPARPAGRTSRARARPGRARPGSRRSRSGPRARRAAA